MLFGIFCSCSSALVFPKFKNVECCSDDLDGDAKERQYSFCFSRRYLCFVMIAKNPKYWRQVFIEVN